MSEKTMTEKLQRIRDLEKKLSPGCPRAILKELISLEDELREIEEKQWTNELKDAVKRFFATKTLEKQRALEEWGDEDEDEDEDSELGFGPNI